MIHFPQEFNFETPEEKPKPSNIIHGNYDEFLALLDKDKPDFLMFHKPDLLGPLSQLCFVDGEKTAHSTPINSSTASDYERLFEITEPNDIIEAAGVIEKIAAGCWRYHFTPHNCFPSNRVEFTACTLDAWVEVMNGIPVEDRKIHCATTQDTGYLCGFHQGDQYLLPVPLDPMRGWSIEHLLKRIDEDNPLDVSWLL